MTFTSVKVSTTIPIRKVHVLASQPYGFVEENLNMPVTVKALPQLKPMKAA
jgi:hypothetical protein